VKVPAYGYGFQLASVLVPGVTPLPEALKALTEEVQGLFREVDDVLARIENLNTRR